MEEFLREWGWTALVAWVVLIALMLLANHGAHRDDKEDDSNGD